MANTVHGYVSQSDKGEMVIGGGLDRFNNYTQRGKLPAWIERRWRALIETFPGFSRCRMLRQWGGIVDMTGDRSPISARRRFPALPQLRLGHRRLQGDPGSGWATAQMLARGTGRRASSPRPSALDRFAEGR